MNEPAQTSGRSINSWLYLALSFVGGYGDAAGFVLAKLANASRLRACDNAVNAKTDRASPA